MKAQIVVVGAGGFGREALDVAQAMQAEDSTIEVLGVVDDAPSEVNLGRLDARGVPYLGTITQWLEMNRSAGYVIGIGSPAVRQSVAARFDRQGRTAHTLVHPSAQLGSAISIGDGTVICAAAVISTNVILGRHVHLNPNCTVGHDTSLGDFVSVNPAAVISGDCRVDDGVLVGANATILQGLNVGERALVGAAACVIRSVIPGAVVKGIPAK